MLEKLQQFAAGISSWVGLLLASFSRLYLGFSFVAASIAAAVLNDLLSTYMQREQNSDAAPDCPETALSR